MTGDTNAPILRLENVTVSRGRDTILSNISLDVRRGSIHVIIGPNGAGKSTLLAAVLGQTQFGGRITATWTGSGAIGYVPQTFAVDRTLPVTVADFLALTRQRRPICLGIGAAARRQITSALDRVGLRDFLDRPLSVLSGGELRRVLLAHALDPLPELLILDEPAAGLDAAAHRWLEDALVSARGTYGITVLMVSHDIDQARRIASTVTLIDRAIIANGRADEALSHVSWA